MKKRRALRFLGEFMNSELLIAVGFVALVACVIGIVGLVYGIFFLISELDRRSKDETRNFRTIEERSKDVQRTQELERMEHISVDRQ